MESEGEVRRAERRCCNFPCACVIQHHPAHLHERPAIHAATSMSIDSLDAEHARVLVITESISRQWFQMRLVKAMANPISADASSSTSCGGYRGIELSLRDTYKRTRTMHIRQRMGQDGTPTIQGQSRRNGNK